MDALEPWHLIVVAIVGLVLFFGWKQLPEMSRSLGQSLRIFRREIKATTADGEPNVTAMATTAVTTPLHTTENETNAA